MRYYLHPSLALSFSMDDDTNLSTVQFSYSEFQKVWNRHGEFSLRKRKQGGLLLYLINLLFGRVKDIQKKLLSQDDVLLK